MLKGKENTLYVLQFKENDKFITYKSQDFMAR